MNGLWSVIIIAVGLAMDTFAVSIVSGGTYKELHIRHSLRMAGFFGGFQAFMPIIGYLAGLQDDHATEKQKLQQALALFTELKMPSERDAVQAALAQLPSADT